jgi:5'-deoxynucleotidase YfbR-like HD superfamily hydrolase
VARIILALHPSPSVGLIRAALTHDDGESVTGDMSATLKQANPAFARALRSTEFKARTDLWGPDPAISSAEERWLKFADRLDAYMWAAHHAPHIMDRDGWPELLAWINETADVLGVKISV